jgi:hypothetical protein
VTTKPAMMGSNHSNTWYVTPDEIQRNLERLLAYPIAMEIEF